MGLCKSSAWDAIAGGGEARALEVVTDVRESAANAYPSTGGLTLWDLFVALQDAADESGMTQAEADDAAVKAYFGLARYVV